MIFFDFLENMQLFVDFMFFSIWKKKELIYSYVQEVIISYVIFLCVNFEIFFCKFIFRKYDKRL